MDTLAVWGLEHNSHYNDTGLGRILVFTINQKRLNRRSFRHILAVL
jgi:hypothetical protein